MTVGELIERLQRLDPSLEARVYTRRGDTQFEIRETGLTQFEIRELGLYFRNEKNERQPWHIPLVREPHPIVFCKSIAH